MKNTLALVLMVFGIVGCSDTSTTDNQPKPSKISPTQTEINQILTALKSENADVVGFSWQSCMREKEPGPLLYPRMKFI